MMIKKLAVLKKVNRDRKKLMMKKYGNKVRDQIVWKQVRDGAQGSLKNEPRRSLKSEMELEDH